MTGGSRKIVEIINLVLGAGYVNVETIVGFYSPGNLKLVISH